MKEIKLTQGQIALVDDEEFNRLSNYTWVADKRNNKFYVSAWNKGKKGNLLMHRFILSAQKGQIIDHIDGNPLNNQRSNLRIATRSQNGANTLSVLPKHNTSGYRGVHWLQKKRKWVACISYLGRSITIGTFKDIIQAADAYNKAAIKYHGEFARLNNIGD